MRAKEFVFEKLNRNGSNELVIFDIDDTLLHTTAKINVIKDGKVIRSLTNQEFNNYKLQPGEEFDFGEFRNAEKFEKESVPIGPMLDQLRSDLAAGHDVVMLTARADFDNQKAVWRTFKRHGIDINRDVHLYRAGNLPGSDAPAHKKAIHVTTWLKTGRYNKVTMYDDSEKNLSVFKSLQKHFPDVKFSAHHVSETGDTTQLEAWSNKYKRSINCNNPKGFSQRAHCQGRKKNEDVKLEELFNPKLAVDLEWAEGSDYIAARGYVTVTDQYGNNEDVELEVEFGEFPHRNRKEYEVQFKVGDSYDITGGGNANVIFATVIQACKDFVEMYNPDRLFFTAKEQSRARMYDTITKRVAKEVGWHVIPFDEIQKDPLYRNRSDNGFVFVIQKGAAPKKWADVQNPQHGSFIPIFYVYNMDKDQPSVAVKVKAPNYSAAIKHAMEIEPSFRDLDHMQMNAMNTLPKREITKVIDGGTAEVGGPKQSKKVGENFADGRNPQDKGDSKRYGVPTKASVSTLRKVAKQGGRKGQLAHWMANMKAGKAKKNK